MKNESDVPTLDPVEALIEMCDQLDVEGWSAANVVFSKAAKEALAFVVEKDVEKNTNIIRDTVFEKSLADIFDRGAGVAAFIIHFEEEEQLQFVMYDSRGHVSQISNSKYDGVQIYGTTKGGSGMQSMGGLSVIKNKDKKKTDEWPKKKIEKKKVEASDEKTGLTENKLI